MRGRDSEREGGGERGRDTERGREGREMVGRKGRKGGGGSKYGPAVVD